MGSTDVVLTDTSPYGSRAVTVEQDGASSVAYLRDGGGGIHGAVWLANHGPAPSYATAGPEGPWRSPVMPVAHTRVPEGTAPITAGELEVLWFEEGDGAALYRNGELLAVIPGWSDLEHGMPGYARDAVGESPLAWSLQEALEGLAPRIAKARSYWEWRGGDSAWPSFQQFVMSHLDVRVGGAGRYWDLGADHLPTVGVTERPKDGYTVLSTVGMSCQRMPTVEQYIERPDTYARVELAVATRGEPTDAARLFLWLARYPWRSVTWLGHGHTARWYDEPASFPLGAGYDGVLMLDTVPGLPDLSGFAFSGDEVRWLWLVPVTEQELQHVAEHGHQRLTLAGRIP
ncbi:suppressor of fused domain protein [Sphaerisporangium sp. TRM90804]|uniref:suppressor of fused domain protein n=1 Tax=Sphaerisporangium sp. TRM90804 TaxID=3031113 RepID=UPI0024492863|nr:suppressor of fused domain protein [Sphaerisporangium sp. TRM90804]MDH2430113.1 suppressor of fused domain protein [Sphaerisporangium sp. TRM90804]